jgi:4-amino-4-deoxy-L-arabinose transferase-like glycosyltransferase
MFGAGVAGPLRLFFGGELAGQWSWLFPLVALGLVAAALGLRRRLPLEPRAQALILWVGWLATYGVVFSMAEGIFHPYYLIMLAPPMAALAGIGLAALWSAYRKGGWQAWLLPVALVATALWQNVVLSAYPQWAVWLIPLTLGTGLLAAVLLAAIRLFDSQVWRSSAPGLLSAGMLGLLLAPAVWAATPVVASPNNASLPLAGPSAISDTSSSWTRMDGQQTAGGLASYLQENRDGYFYLVAVTNSQQASSIALGTGQPVLAMGGFMGSDPAMTVERLQQMIANREVRFVMAGGGGFRSGSSSVSQWVQSNCTPVDSSEYGGQSGSGFGGPGGPGGFMGGNSGLYNCAAY